MNNDELRAAIARVRDLHAPTEFYGGEHCDHCSWEEGEPEPYPCPTVRALEGVA